MNILWLFFLIVIPFENYQFTDIKGNKYEIVNEQYILIYLSGWNCVDCIRKTTDYLKSYSVPKSQIYFVIETTDDIYAKAGLKKLIEKKTDYYNRILFNPKSVVLNDVKNSYFLKHSDNNRTPALLIKSDKFHFYQYDNIFLKSNDVKLDMEGVEVLRRFKIE